jgi:hypothetical protein
MTGLLAHFRTLAANTQAIAISESNHNELVFPRVHGNSAIFAEPTQTQRNRFTVRSEASRSY